MTKRVISFALILLLLISTLPFGVFGAQSEQTLDVSEFDYFLNKYSEQAAFAKAVYTGGYDAASFGDEMRDLYAFGHLYTKLSNPKRGSFDGYIHTLEEAKNLFGEQDEGVLAAIENEVEYVSDKYDNSFRHEKDIADVDGVKKDCWFTTSYIRKDKNEKAKGGIAFGIKDGSKISESDSGVTIIFEYLDNGGDNISFQYVNTSWQGTGFVGSTVSFHRKGTGKWKAGIITVEDAMFAREDDKKSTGLCRSKEDFVFKGDDIYISAVMVLKNSQIKESASTTAVYSGGYDATEFNEEINDLYVYSKNYAKHTNRGTFNGYIYTIDEAKKVFGETDEKVVAAQNEGYKYYAPQSDNCLRYEKDVADKIGIKKDSWMSTDYWRGDKGEKRNGSITFGIKDGSRIKETDRELTFRIEYLDKSSDPMRLQYVNSKWNGESFSGTNIDIKRTGSNEWKTAYVSVTDAYFAPESDTRTTKLRSGKEDFAIIGKDLYIHSVTIIKTPLTSIIQKKYDNLPAAVYEKKDEVTGRTWYAMQIPGKRTFRSYVTVQNWNKDGTKFVVSDGYGLYEFDTLNYTYRFLDHGQQGSCYVSPENDIYYIYGGYANKIDWDTYQKTVICKMPEELSSLGSLSVSNDGKYMSGYYYGNQEGVTLSRFNTQKGMADYLSDKDFTYNPDTMGVGHPILNHVYPNILFFCHEGTTTLIPDRLWMVDINTGKMENIFRQSYLEDGKTGETSGHEVWGMDGNYLYFVKYTFKTNKGQNGIVRIPFKNGQFTGEREYINGDAAYWHCYPSGDDNWVVADVNTGEVWIMSTNTHKAYQIADFELVPGERTDPHPHFSFANNTINWDIDFDGDTGKRGVAWADVSDITFATEHNRGTIDLSENCEAVSVTNTRSESKNETVSGKSFVKATSGNRVYVNIKDNVAKSTNQSVKLSFTTYSDVKTNMTVGYTSPVLNDSDWHKFEDRIKVKEINKGVTNHVIDMGNININNINQYASDFYFVSDTGTTYITDVKVDILSGGDEFASAKAGVVSATPSSFAGLKTFDELSTLVDINDQTAIDSMELSASNVQTAKNEGYSYMTVGLDGAFAYKNITDRDGVTKNVWFTTKSKRFKTNYSANLSGFLYFALTDDAITANDNNLRITIEYLDNREKEFYIQYANSKGGTNYSKITVKPTGTGKWKRETFTVKDAGMSNSEELTAFLDGRADIRIMANEEDLYVAEIKMEKTVGKYIHNVSANVSTNGICYSVNAVNNTDSDMNVRLFAAVYDQNGQLKRIETSQSTKVLKNSSNDISSNEVTVNKDEYAKVFAFSDNVIPLVPSDNHLELKVRMTGEVAKLTWKEQQYDYTVMYKIFCDGIQVGATYDTQIEITGVSSGSHIWHIEATDVYGNSISSYSVADNYGIK